MAEILLFHHLQGLTDGVRALAGALGAGGHTVHLPDLFDGEQPASVEEGSALVKRIGADVLDRRADRIAADLRPDLVHVGVSWGAAIAQRLAQTRAGARAALLYEACLPVTGEWAIGPWPDGVAVQVHGMERDPFFGLEGDVDAARELVSIVGPDRGELFVYPGDRHLFTDSSLPSYDAEATTLVVTRSRDLLARLG
ncbi:dienelactone hydrolase family protein [Micromonospora sp. RP3T]|uniref:dienelactone hydrolase family protein n=1 Tax=Micromonospora sp. RP3T TaxID=2135446 RepID=UPI000D16A57B|nr:dienelactone hydrolase family protein [Micromonospora sp. RP3T]PTA44593.1 dienelactone hydrolase [Micromonospora sp. RP3T]